MVKFAKEPSRRAVALAFLSFTASLNFFLIPSWSWSAFVYVELPTCPNHVLDAQVKPKFNRKKIPVGAQ